MLVVMEYRFGYGRRQGSVVHVTTWVGIGWRYRVRHACSSVFYCGIRRETNVPVLEARLPCVLWQNRIQMQVALIALRMRCVPLFSPSVDFADRKVSFGQIQFDQITCSGIWTIANICDILSITFSEKESNCLILRWLSETNTAGAGIYPDTIRCQLSPSAQLSALTFTMIHSSSVRHSIDIRFDL